LSSAASAPEISQGDDWDRHWSDYADAAERNPAQRFRRRVVASLLGLGDEPARVLDIGSGQGDFAAELMRRHPQVDLLGLEVSEAGNEIARRKVPAASFEQVDLLQTQNLPSERRGWATHAVCSEVLEHVDRPDVLLANATAYMAPACRLVVTVPGGPMSAFDRHIGHRRHFTPDDLRTLLADAGFDVEIACGAGFPFFNLYRLVVIMRGKSLIDDVSSQDGNSGSRLARAVMAVFGVLLRLTRTHGRRGWQTIAVAHPRATDGADSRL
jgi:SAM-dependent methyltransferase